jgi:hypothetical protein
MSNCRLPYDRVEGEGKDTKDNVTLRDKPVKSIVKLWQLPETAPAVTKDIEENSVSRPAKI